MLIATDKTFSFALILFDSLLIVFSSVACSKFDFIFNRDSFVFGFGVRVWFKASATFIFALLNSDLIAVFDFKVAGIVRLFRALYIISLANLVRNTFAVNDLSN